MPKVAAFCDTPKRFSVASDVMEVKRSDEPVIAAATAAPSGLFEEQPLDLAPAHADSLHLALPTPHSPAVLDHEYAFAVRGTHRGHPSATVLDRLLDNFARDRGAGTAAAARPQPVLAEPVAHARRAPIERAGYLPDRHSSIRKRGELLSCERSAVHEPNSSGLAGRKANACS